MGGRRGVVSSLCICTRLAAVGLAVAIFSSCSSPWRCPDPYPQEDYVVVRSQATITGPLPVYRSYNGFEPLGFTIRAGLFKPGSNIIAATFNLNAATGSAWDSNYNATFDLDCYASEDRVNEEAYELGFYSMQDPYSWPEAYGGGGSGIVLARGEQVSIDFDADTQTVAPLVLNFTGPGPYGSASGRLLISGPAFASPITQLVLKPDEPALGVDASTGLVWQVDSAAKRHGQVWFTIPGLSYGGYELSYAGSMLHDRSHPESYASVPISPSASQPAITGITFNISSTPEPNPQWVLGHIGGSLVLPGAPAPESAYCLEFRRSDVPDTVGSSYEYTYRATQWCLVAADFNAAHTAVFNSGWLDVGTYHVTVYELAGEPSGDDLLLDSFGPFVLAEGALEVADAVLELEP
jgi:hypothetical protein